MNGSAKGSEFERKICRQLSLWWSGNQRDDLFWRTSQSGGRATTRMKTGKRTAGAYGDITAVDQDGAGLTKMWTLELKKGKSHGTPDDLLEGNTAKTRKPSPFGKTLLQAYGAHVAAGSLGWMLIAKRDFRETLVFVDSWTAKKVDLHPGSGRGFSYYSYRVGGVAFKFVGLRLNDFLDITSRERVEAALRKGKT